MPRPKVPDAARRRSAQACERCRRRKEKCDGKQPCSLCARRGTASECHFSEGASRNGRHNSLAKPIQLRDDMPDTSDAEIAIESLLNLSGSHNNPRKHHRNEREDETASHAPVPKLARLLRDGKGKFMFIGDSANLSFLQNIRRLVKSSIGDTPFTTDHLRHSMVESTPAHATWTGSQDLPSHQRPTLEDSKELIHQYSLATSGVIDLFDAEDLMRHLPVTWQENPSKENEFTSSIYYLVLAIGAQARRADGDQKRAELYFNHGRQLAVLSFMDDPSVLTIQSYALITMYMLGACRRNGAFMNLGIAVRAAHALGLHRSDTSALFCGRERQARERVWKSIRVLDIFLSASLGRPTATSECENDVTSWNQLSTAHEEGSIDAKSFSASVSLCFIFERILTEVYGKRMVSTSVAESISQQHREWTSALPTGLKIDGLERRIEENGDNLRQLLFMAHLNTAYYWSIVLLTRPFLVYRVSAHIKHKGAPYEETNDKNSHSSLISTFADACVNSAVQSMNIVHDLIQHNDIPKSLPVIINSMFVSSLVLGVAFFGDFDRSFPLRRSLEKAENGLRFFWKFDPTARRYVQIIEHLRGAVDKYVGKRERRAMENRRKLVSHMFGDFGQVLGSPPMSDISGGGSITAGTPDAVQDRFPLPSQEQQQHQQQQQQQQQQQLNRLQYNTQWNLNPLGHGQNGALGQGQSQGPTLTTSGFLAGAGSMPTNQQNAGQVFTMLPPFAESGISHLSPDSASLPPYAEEIQLFSLLNDYDPLLNGSYMLDTG